MIYAVNLMINDTGTSILKVDCLGIFGDKIDLVSGFLTALTQFVVEVFKTDGVKSIDIGGMTVQIVDKEAYRVVLITDNDEDENRIVLDILDTVLEDETEIIDDARKGSIKVKPMSILEIKILDAISDFATRDIDHSILAPIRDRITEFIVAFEKSNLATRIRLLATRIKIGKVLDEDTALYEVMLEDVSTLMDKKKDKAFKWLKRIKNWIYEEYIDSESVKEMKWGMLYKYLSKFSDKLKKITKSEIALKYIRMAETVLHSGSSLDDIDYIANEIIKMDDIIDTYIRF